MTQPIELLVEEPLPGSYVWRLLQTDDQGGNPRVLRTSPDPADTYEGALAAGQAALRTEMRRHAAASS